MSGKQIVVLAVLGLCVGGTALAEQKAGWWTAWSHENQSTFELGEFSGRKNIYIVRPASTKKPFAWKCKVTLVKGSPSTLSLDVSAHKLDWKLVINVNGKKILEQHIAKGSQWQSVKAGLGSPGETVEIEMLNVSLSSNHEPSLSYWDNVKIEPTPQ